MRKLLRLSLIIFALAFGLAGCRSKKSQVAVPPATEEVAPKWINVQMPIRLEVAQPVNFAVNGTATMVRGKYILMSFRLMGFEFAQAYVTPKEFDLVIKPQKNWLQEPMVDRLTSRGLEFQTLQEAMLGNPKAFENVPQSLSLKRGGTKDDPVVQLKTKMAGMAVDVTVSWSLDDARWNLEKPATFTPPGDSYSKMTLKNATNFLGK